MLSPARAVPLAFLLVIGVGAAVLMLPVAHVPGRRTGFLEALFTAVSATCVTGLAVVDTATHWSLFGQVVILTLIQVGGFGIVTLSTLLSLVVIGRLDLSTTLRAQAESHAVKLSDARRMPLRVGLLMLAVESVVAVVLTIRFRIAYDDTWGSAAWHGIWHAVTGYNNAGVTLWSDNLVRFASDGWIVFPICLAVVLGGLGFPVWFELRHRWRRPRNWSIHLRITLFGYLALLAVGVVLYLAFEWRNPATLGPLDLGGKLVSGIGGGVFPRTAGFNTVDVAGLRQENFVMHYVLMFVGGGSASTAGGIKVTTFVLLGYVIWSELRGEPETTVAHRRISSETQRHALSVALLGVGAVMVGTMVILVLTELPLQEVMFEAISAFSTVGMTTGVTAQLPPGALGVLMVLMFVGRVGTITVGSALALNTGRRHHRLPEERPIVG